MTEPDNASLLRDVLKSRRLTQQQAAALVGMDRSQLNGYTTGRLTIGEAAAEKIEVGLELPDGYFKRTLETRAVTLAELAVLMQAARSAQERQWGDLRELAGEVSALGEDVRGIATDLAGLVSDLGLLAAFLRSALEPPDSGHGRRSGEL